MKGTVSKSARSNEYSTPFSSGHSASRYPLNKTQGIMGDSKKDFGVTSPNVLVKDGVIYNLSVDMEYSIDGGVNWIDVTTPEVSGLRAGEVLVRYKQWGLEDNNDITSVIIGQPDEK